MEDRYKACIVIHAIGDTIGFRDGIWEFNYNSKNFTLEDMLEIIFDFIGLGGINHLDTKNWLVSDDTVLHLATAETYLQAKDVNKIGSIYNTVDILVQNYIKEFVDPKMGKRFPGITTTNITNQIKNGQDWKTIAYSNKSGGSGAAMRTLCLGLIYNGEKNRDKLIYNSLEASRSTHNCTTGYLGGIVSALFTAFAVENKPLEEWPFELIDILESDIIDKYLKNTRGFIDYDKDKHIFIGKWKQYIEDKFDETTHKFKEPMYNLVWRSKYYYNNFSESMFIGAGGDDSVIIAFDCLVDSKGNFEKLVFYSMLHAGDTDTTGCIAGGWYGAVHGFKDVPTHLINNLEMNNRITKLGQKLYEKFYKL